MATSTSGAAMWQRERDYFDDPKNRKQGFLDQKVRFSDDEAEKLAKIAKLRRLQPKQRLYKRGDLGNRLFFVFEGSCKLLNKDRSVRAELGKGEVLGETPFLNAGSTYTVTVVAKEETVIAEVMYDSFEEIVANSHERIAPTPARRLEDVSAASLAKRKAANSRAKSKAPVASAVTTTIFISYRRDDSAGHAGRVMDRLEREFGRDRLFMDVDSIPFGTDFVKVLREEVKKCGVLLAVIGPRWSDAQDEDGSRRLDNRNDFVRIEIAAALRRNIPVIPILLDGARIPKASQLPDELKGLASRTGLDVRHASFRSDMDRLIHRLKAEKGRQGQDSGE